MDGWFKRGRAELLDAVTSVYDRIDQDLTNERARHAGRTVALEARLSKLEEENRILKDQLQQQKEEQKSGTPSEDDRSGLEREYAKLYTKYTHLTDNYKTVCTSRATHKSLSVELQSNVKALERRVAQLETQNEETVSTTQGTADSADPPQPLLRVTNTTRSPSATSDLIANPQLLPLLPGAEDAPSTVVKIKPEPSSDGPIFLSAKYIGKRKRGADATPKVKKEDGSHPIHTGDIRDFSPQESMDLDDTAISFLTPKKRRPLSWRSAELDTHDDNPTGSHTPRIRVHRDETRRGAPESSCGNTSKVGNTTMTPSARSTRLVHKNNSTTVTPAGGKSPLAPMSPNKSRRRTRRLSNSEKSDNLPAAIASLAEDGVDYCESAPCEKPAQDTPVGNSRVGALLDVERPVENETPLIRRRKPSSPRPRSISPGPMMPLPRRALALDTPKEPRKQRTASPKTSRTSRQGQESGRRTATTAPKGPPLRSLPVSELRVEHFKVNPRFNNGYDYAFTEVVRDRNERSRLPGCSDENCCGKHFRELALTGANDRDPKADRELLEEYLGDDCYKLGTATKAEKDEWWLEAKTWELANKFGKHRHTYGRRASPPGFWDADFPSTQKLESDRRKAQQKERDIVQARYREAVRPDGRWLFKDE